MCAKLDYSKDKSRARVRRESIPALVVEPGRFSPFPFTKSNPLRAAVALTDALRVVTLQVGSSSGTSGPKPTPRLRIQKPSSATDEKASLVAKLQKRTKLQQKELFRLSLLLEDGIRRNDTLLVVKMARKILDACGRA